MQQLHEIIDADGTRRPALPVILAHAKQGNSVLLVGSFAASAISLVRAVHAGLPPITTSELDRVNQARVAAHLDATTERPFRAPHYTCSELALFGSTRSPWQGELQLARHGVLLLDQAPEFRPMVLARTMAAVASGRADYGRGNGTTFVAEVYPQWVVGTALPCPCGHLNSKRCSCQPGAVLEYQNRLAKVAALFTVRRDIDYPWHS